jgi:hypothetical protein
MGGECYEKKKKDKMEGMKNFGGFIFLHYSKSP